MAAGVETPMGASAQQEQQQGPCRPRVGAFGAPLQPLPSPPPAGAPEFADDGGWRRSSWRSS